MDLMRKNVLASTALAGEKNRCVAGGGALRRLQQSLHHRVVRFEQGGEIVRGARQWTIGIFACFIHGRPLVQRSGPWFETDNVNAETFATDQQV